MLTDITMAGTAFFDLGYSDLRATTILKKLAGKKAVLITARKHAARKLLSYLPDICSMSPIALKSIISSRHLTCRTNT